MRKFYVFGIILILTSCMTMENKRTKKEDWSFDNYLLEIQKNTSKQRYTTAITTLNELQKKYPEQEKIMINYLIGFNYYSIKAYSSARKYLNLVLSMYGDLTIQGEIVENEKFDTLSRLLLDKIEENEKYFDPYRVREQREEKGKKIKPALD